MGRDPHHHSPRPLTTHHTPSLTHLQLAAHRFSVRRGCSRTHTHTHTHRVWVVGRSRLSSLLVGPRGWTHDTEGSRARCTRNSIRDRQHATLTPLISLAVVLILQPPFSFSFYCSFFFFFSFALSASGCRCGALFGWTSGTDFCRGTCLSLSLAVALALTVTPPSLSLPLSLPPCLSLRRSKLCWAVAPG